MTKINIDINNLLIDNTHEIDGHLIRIRVEPPEFRLALKNLNNLIESKQFKLANDFYESLCVEWKNDCEFIRLITFISFMKD